VPVLTSVLLRVDQDIGPVSGIVAIQDYIYYHGHGLGYPKA
jgi:hypothetical protein